MGLIFTRRQKGQDSQTETANGICDTVLTSHPVHITGEELARESTCSLEQRGEQWDPASRLVHCISLNLCII